MIKHRKNIIINANIEKVWFFMIDFSRSLIFDTNYTLVELPTDYSVNHKLKFRVQAKYITKKIVLNGTVKECYPPHNLSLHFINETGFSFNHFKIFKLKSMNDKTILEYTINGDFNHFILNTFYGPVLKLKFNLELEYIKKAIESSENNINTKKLQTMVK
tara:strand:- start:259 stop:738 length:480 start_codon:yes stop_codon:yes gene_type:complete